MVRTAQGSVGVVFGTKFEDVETSRRVKGAELTIIYLGMILHISSINIHICLLFYVIVHYIANSTTCLTKSIMSSASDKQGYKRGIFCPQPEIRVWEGEF